MYMLLWAIAFMQGFNNLPPLTHTEKQMLAFFWHTNKEAPAPETIK